MKVDNFARYHIEITKSGLRDYIVFMSQGNLYSVGHNRKEITPS